MLQPWFLRKAPFPHQTFLAYTRKVDCSRISPDRLAKRFLHRVDPQISLKAPLWDQSRWSKSFDVASRNFQEGWSSLLHFFRLPARSRRAHRRTPEKGECIHTGVQNARGYTRKGREKDTWRVQQDVTRLSCVGWEGRRCAERSKAYNRVCPMLHIGRHEYR